MAAHAVPLDGGLLALFGAITLAAVIVVGNAAQKRQVARSLATIGTRRPAADRDPVPVPTRSMDRLLARLLKRLTAAAKTALPNDAKRGVASRLERAGNPYGWDLDQVLAYKSFAMLVLGGFGAMIGHSTPAKAFALAAVFGTVGFFLPDVWLYNTALKRQEQIQKTLADALDMLTISVEAGLAFDAALSQVARNTEGPLAAEFSRILQEMQIGKGRSEAFRSVLDRTNVEDLRTFVNAIAQADVFGVPIANVLRTQAKEMRQKRRQSAEEKAQKVPVKIVVPLVLCILPALFVAVLGPGVISIIHVFGGMRH